MKNIKRFILRMMICSCMTIPMVYANDTGGMHEQKERRIQEIYNQLNLSEDQKKQVDTNKQNQKAQKKVVFEQMKAQKEAMRQELMKPNLDMNKINSLQAELKAVHLKMMDNRLNSILEVRKILTTEQFEKFSTLMKKHEHEETGKDESKER